MPAIAACALLVVLVWQRDDLSQGEVGLAVTRAAAVLLVVGSLPLLDDVAFDQVGSVPFSLLKRELPRLLAMTAMVLGPVAILGSVADLPWRGVLIEAAALLAFGAATGLILRTRLGHLEPSIPVSVVLLVLTLALWAAPARYQMWVQPGPDWIDAHRRWLTLLAGSVAVAAYALRDPAARFRWHPRRPSQRGL